MTGHNSDDLGPDAPLPPALYDSRPLPFNGARLLYEAARENPRLPLRELSRLLAESIAIHFAGPPSSWPTTSSPDKTEERPTASPS